MIVTKHGNRRPFFAHSQPTDDVLMGCAEGESLCEVIDIGWDNNNGYTCCMMDGYANTTIMIMVYGNF